MWPEQQQRTTQNAPSDSLYQLSRQIELPMDIIIRVNQIQNLIKKLHLLESFNLNL